MLVFLLNKCFILDQGLMLVSLIHGQCNHGNNAWVHQCGECKETEAAAGGLDGNTSEMTQIWWIHFVIPVDGSGATFIYLFATA